MPPKPEGYDELASELDRARWEARQNGGADRAADADQRDWESGGHAQDPGYGANAAVPVDPAAGGARPDTSGGQSAEEAERRASELDAYLLGRVLNDLADDYRELLGIVDDGESFQYAFALRPYERVAALRMLARKLLESDPNPPAELRHLARA